MPIVKSGDRYRYVLPPGDLPPHRTLKQVQASALAKAKAALAASVGNPSTRKDGTK